MHLSVTLVSQKFSVLCGANVAEEMIGALKAGHKTRQRHFLIQPPQFWLKIVTRNCVLQTLSLSHGTNAHMCVRRQTLFSTSAVAVAVASGLPSLCF